MFTRTHSGNSFAKTATKAAALIDENVHWGADAVSKYARQTADQFEKATGYVQQQSVKFKRQAAQLSEKAAKHPGRTLIAVGAIAFSLGLLIRRTRRA